MKTEEIDPGSICKNCGHDNDAHTGTQERQIPQPGDWSVCFYCGFVARYGPNLELVSVTKTDLDNLQKGSPDVYDHLMEVSAGIKRYRLHTKI